MKCLTIIGNLGANAVMRTTTDGKQLMSFNVAVNTSGEPIWVNCIGNYREKLFPYLLKGQCVCVVGDVSFGVYQNKVDVSVNIDKCELCGKAPEQPSQPSATEEPVKEVY